MVAIIMGGDMCLLPFFIKKAQKTCQDSINNRTYVEKAAIENKENNDRESPFM
jgi:hypothetical protein